MCFWQSIIVICLLGVVKLCTAQEVSHNMQLACVAYMCINEEQLQACGIVYHDQSLSNLATLVDRNSKAAVLCTLNVVPQ